MNSRAIIQVFTVKPPGKPLLETGCTDLGLSNQMAPILAGPMRLTLPLLDVRLQIYLRELGYED